MKATGGLQRRTAKLPCRSELVTEDTLAVALDPGPLLGRPFEQELMGRFRDLATWSRGRQGTTPNLTGHWHPTHRNN